MPVLTDRQRIELAIPAYLLYTLTLAPGVFIPAAPELAEKAEGDVSELRRNLQVAYLEPFADLTPSKGQALIRRLDRLRRQTITDFYDRPALSLVLIHWCFLADLTDREVLILWEGSAMDKATRKLRPMCNHGFEDKAEVVEAQEQARVLLNRLQAEGLYR
ncbi:hypothetical protein [Methylobacterium sp. Leaf85]|uniref:hypothetical protein n=1 Tax=Methylobacterium sp. Leaf85 TaxID=1736241 RepID=UPI0006F28FE6|nr:hypothetical protein [Methylobacterium sp. Leaf85]KQO52523.1 hypothetical protein ASF08_20625 [Methylobacterium sp. Leaf85]